MTVRLACEIGFDKVSDIGERMGIYDKLPPYEAMALGAGDTTLMRMATAYAELVNGGKQVRPVMFDRIQNRYGETVYRTDQRACDGCATRMEERPPAAAAGRRAPAGAGPGDGLSDGVDPRRRRRSAARARPSVRSASRSRPRPARPTTSSMRGPMGFSPDLVVGVWVGFDTPRDMGNGESGGRVAAPIFRDFMLAALKDRPARHLPRSERRRARRGGRRHRLPAGAGHAPHHHRGVQARHRRRPIAAKRRSGADGYRVDFSKMAAGDETASSTRDGQADVAARAG